MTHLHPVHRNILRALFRASRGRLDAIVPFKRLSEEMLHLPEDSYSDEKHALNDEQLNSYIIYLHSSGLIPGARILRHSVASFVKEVCVDQATLSNIRQHISDDDVGAVAREDAMPQNSPKRTFIVHGHDIARRLELTDFIERMLKLPRPIVLEEVSQHGQTIIESFENFAGEAAIVFVMLTPDDARTDNTTNYVHRARENVIFEMGYFIGKLGRYSGRVVLLKDKDVAMPSDLHGMKYIDISHGIKAVGEDIRGALEPFMHELQLA